MINSCVLTLNKPPPQPIPEESNLSHYKAAGLNLTHKTAIMKKDKSDTYCHWLTNIVLLIPVTFKLTIKMYEESIHQKMTAAWPFTLLTRFSNHSHVLPHVLNFLMSLDVVNFRNSWFSWKKTYNSFHNHPPSM